MIRDMELVRAVLLHVESVHEGDSPIIMDLKNSAFDDFDPKVVYGHCLLYTSPSPRDRQKSRMPSSA